MFIDDGADDDAGALDALSPTDLARAALPALALLAVMAVDGNRLLLGDDVAGRTNGLSRSAEVENDMRLLGGEKPSSCRCRRQAVRFWPTRI